MSFPGQNLYEDGSYLANNPSWHEEDAPFKAKYIVRLLNKNAINFDSIAEVGCGIGAVIKAVKKITNVNNAKWSGFDISEEAIYRARLDKDSKAINFVKKDVCDVSEFFDVLMVVDVFEHIPDYIGFVRQCRQKARYKIYHIPLDLHVSAVLRESLLNAREKVGHLHYFTEKTALAALLDTGHKIIDTMLTPGAIELFKKHPSVKRAIGNVPRAAVGRFSPSLSARLFGGFSLLALTQ